jgi:hypothetical protein
LALDDRLRHHPAGGRHCGLVRLGGRGLLGPRLHPGRDQHVAFELLGRIGDDGVVGQQREQRGVARRGLGQDRRDTVQAPKLLAAVCLGRGLVGVDASTFLPHEQGDDLEPRAYRRRRPATLDGRLDLADGTGEHRQHAGLAVAGTPPTTRRRTGSGTGRGTGSAGPALASSGQELLL